MNKKKVTTIIALALVVVVAMVTLAACNPYKWSSVGGGDSTATVISNGGYYVEQGGYAYFINGYVGDNDDNTWGTPYKQSIMRAVINEDGTIDNDTAVVVVPKSIYNEYSGGGFAIFGEWIYYATPNNEEDRTGTASTTYTDFMRTKIDGSVTQRIGTVASREYEYIFTPTRIIYVTGSSTYTISYFDFSGMSSTKATDNGSGAYSGTLASNVSSYVWGYDVEWNSSDGTVVSDYIFYTQTNTDDDSYRHYNRLYAIKYDGTNNTLLATYDTYFDEGDSIESGNTYDKVYTFSLTGIYFDSDSQVTIYYSKSIYINESSTTVGLYCNKVLLASDGTVSFDVSTEKKLTELATTTYFPLGYDNGILATKSSDSYIYLVTENSTDYGTLVIGKEVTVQAYIDGYIYYIDSDGTALYRIKANGSENEQIVVSEGVMSDWLDLEFVVSSRTGTRFYFFNTEDYDYVSYVDLNEDVAAGSSHTITMIGKMTTADAESKAEEEEES